VQAGGGSTAITTRAGTITVEGAPVTTGGGAIELYAGGGAIDLRASITTGGGAIELVAEGGDLTLAAGLSATRTVGAPGPGGTVTLRSVAGSILTAAPAAQWLETSPGSGVFAPVLEWLLTNGRFTVSAATGEVLAANLTPEEEALQGVPNGAVLREAGGAYVQTTGGRIVLSALGEVGQALAGFRFSPLAIYVEAGTVTAGSTERANVSVVATGSVTVGAGGSSGSRGGTTDVISLAGKQTLSSALDANGDDVVIAADDVDVLAAVRSAGADLQFRTIDPTRAIVLGDLSGLADGSAMQLGFDEMQNLRDGFATLVFGSDGGSNQVRITSDTGATVTMKDDVVFFTNGEGGEVMIGTDFVAPSLTIFGSGNTTTLMADATASAGGIAVNDSLRVRGDRVLTALAGGILLGGDGLHFLGGDGAGSLDRLTLDANGGDVRVRGGVGLGNEDTDALNRLHVASAIDVTFDQDLIVDGDLIIEASGVVTFNGSITLRGGGDLIIRGASQVVMRGAVVLLGTAGDGSAGDIVLEADEIDLRMSEEQLRGQGLLVLRPSTIDQQIAVASPAGAGTAGVLNLDADELRTLADGFARIVIGHAGPGGHAAANSGAMTIGARAELDALTFRDHVVFYGTTIRVADTADAGVVLRGGADVRFTFDAVNLIAFENEVEAGTIELYSALGSARQIDALADGLAAEALRAEALFVDVFDGASLGSLEANTVEAANRGANDLVLGFNAARDTALFGAGAIDGSVLAARLVQSDAAQGGSIRLATAGGGVTLGGAGASVAGAGALVIEAGGEGAALAIEATVTTAGGAITLRAAGDLSTRGAGAIAPSAAAAITLEAGGALSLGAGLAAAGGLVDIAAGAGVVIADGVVLSSLGGGANDARRIVIEAVGDIVLSRLEAGSSLAITSSAGGLRDGLAGAAANLVAGTARLVAATGIGEAGAALRTTLDTLSAQNAGVGGLHLAETDGLSLASGGLVVSGSAGDLVLTVEAGALALSGSVENRAAGGALAIATLGAGQALSVAGIVSADGGAVTLASAGDVSMAAGSRVQAKAAGAALDLTAAGALAMAADARLVANGGLMRLEAGGGIVLGQVAAGTGTVLIAAGGAVSDADAMAAAQTVNLAAASVSIVAAGAVGAGGNAIETAIGTLAVWSGGSLWVAEGNGLVIGSVATTTGAVSGTDGTISISNGNTHEGRLVIDGDVVAAGSGPVVLEGRHGSGGITVNAVVDAGTGDLVVQALGDVLFGAAGVLVTAGGDVLIEAGTDVIGAQADAGSGAVTVEAGRDLLDLEADAGGADLTGASVTLAAGGRIGTDTDAIETAAALITASAAGGVAVTGTGATTAFGSVVSGDGARLGATGDLVLAGAVAVQGTLRLEAGGSLRLAPAVAAPTAAAVVLAIGGDAADAGAPLALDTAQVGGAVGGDAELVLLRAEAAVVALEVGGHLGLDATGALRVEGLVTGLDAVIVAAGDLTITGAAVGQHAVFASFADLGVGGVTSGGNTSLTAVGTLIIEGRAEAGGTLGAVAGGDVASGSPDAVLVASQVSVLAGGSVGAAGAPLVVDAAVFAAVAEGALFVELAAPSASIGPAVGLTGVEVRGGPAVLVAAGDLTLDAGVQASGAMRVQAAGAIGVASGVAVIAEGPLSIAAGTSLAVEGAVQARGAGATLDVAAANVVFGTTGSAQAAADLRIESRGDLVIAALASGGTVSLLAGGSILGRTGAGTVPDITAEAARLVAAGGIGTAAERVSLAVGTLAARAGAGGAWLHEADAVRIGDVRASVQRVLANGGVVAVEDTVLSDLVATGGGSIALATTAGSIELTDGSAPADGRAVTVQGGGTLSLVAGGEGAVLDLGDEALEQAGDLIIESALRIEGALEVSAGTPGGTSEADDGDITFTGALDGNPGGTPDTLAVRSQGGSIVFAAAIGGTTPLDGLSITGAEDVRFAADVRLAGDLVIDATGRVVFEGDLVLEGGTLRIQGASEVVIGDTVVTGGDIVIDARGALRIVGRVEVGAGATVDLAVGAFTVEGALVAEVAPGQPAATLLVRPHTPTAGLAFGAAGSGAPGALVLDGATLGAIGGFGVVEFGAAQTGAVMIDAAALAPLVAGEVTVRGASIALQGGAGGPVELGVTGRLDLIATGAATIAGALATAGADIALTAGGSITMQASALIASRGGDITLDAASGITLGLLDARGAVAGGVVLRSAAGTIADAAADGGTNVFAGWLVMRGLGPTLAAGASEAPAAIDVLVERLDVDDARGLLLRDSGADGRTRFNLLEGGTLYQQLVASGGPLRTATAPLPDASAGGGGGGGAGPRLDASAAAWLAALRPLDELRSGFASGREALAQRLGAGGDGEGGLPDDSAAARYLAALLAGESDAAAGAGGVLAPPPAAPPGGFDAMALLDAASFGFGATTAPERAWLLGTAARQPAASGLHTVGSDRFEVWEEDALAL
jgi:hypothetical protein